MSRFKEMQIVGCLLAINCVASLAHAQLTVVADYTFDDPSSLAPFTPTGTPTVSGGQLQLDGSSYLEIADPLEGALDNYVIEGIVTAVAFDAFDFAFARNDPAGQFGGNNGQGLLFQDFGAGPGQINALNSNSAFISDGTATLPTGAPASIAIVQNSGTTNLFVNGALTASAAAGIVGTPTNLGIGTHPFDQAAGAFNGSIDQVRLSTFEVGGFVSSDLLGFVAPQLSLSVSTTTGEAVLNTIDAFPGNVIGYDITSGADIGALNPSGWTSIADNYDGDTNPPGDIQVDVDDAWTELPADATTIAEAELNAPSGDGAQFEAGLAMSLGTIWQPNPFGQDLAMEILLDDGTRQSVPIFYGGVSEINTVRLGDFSGNGTVDAADWPTIRDNFDLDVSSLSVAAGYNLGDINSDGVVNVLDFGEFKTLFIADQGEAAFAALMAGDSVPEPSAGLLLAIVGIAVVGARRKSLKFTTLRRQSVRVLILLVMLGAGLSIGQPQAAAQLNVLADYTFDNGTDLEAEGFTVNGNAAISGNQLVLDGDGDWLTIADPLGGAADNFLMEATFTADTVGTFNFVFARNMGTANNGGGVLFQNGNINGLASLVGFFAATPETLNAPVTASFVRQDGVNSLYVDGELVPAGGGGQGWVGESDTLAIGAHNFDAPNGLLDGSVDRVRLSTIGANDELVVGADGFLEVILPPVLTLEITRGSGNARILNNSGETISLDYYAIASSTGVANPNWTGLAPAGTGDGDGWENLGTPSVDLIQQAYLDGETELLDGAATASLGSVFTGGAQDESGVTFTFRTPAGELEEGLISFVDSVGLPGDFNADGIVDAADYTVWRDNLGGDSSALNGNGSGSPTVVAADYTLWRSSFGNTAGSGSLATGEAVPEPRAVALLSLVLGLFAMLRLRRVPVPAKSRIATSVVAVLACLSLSTQSALAAVTVDRDYRLGDDGLEGGLNGSTLGTANQEPAENGFTLDSMGPTGAFVDLSVNGGPTYVDTSARPGASLNEQGAQFGGSDYLSAAVSMNAPSEMWDNPNFFGDPTEYPLNYEGILSHGIQLWARPNSATQDVRQDIIVDTNQHGIYITDTNNWGMIYDRPNADVDSGVPVEFNEWTHLMHIAGFNDPVGGGSRVGGALYVDGVAVAARNTAYDFDESILSIGANQDGTENFYNGVLDDVSLFLWGDNTGQDNGGAGPFGQDYGTLFLGEDNEWIAQELDRLNVTDRADVDLDGQVDEDDITAFIPNWKAQNLVDGVQVGDWNSRQNGDLDYNGIVDLDDVFILHDGLVSAGFLNGFPFELLNGGTQVPEPTTLSIVAVCGLAAYAVRNRTRRSTK